MYKHISQESSVIRFNRTLLSCSNFVCRVPIIISNGSTDRSNDNYHSSNTTITTVNTTIATAGGTAAAGQQQQNQGDLAWIDPGFSLTDNNAYEPNRFNYCKMQKRDKQKPLTAYSLLLSCSLIML
jgi:hypothetical protein